MKKNKFIEFGENGKYGFFNADFINTIEYGEYTDYLCNHFYDKRHLYPMDSDDITFWEEHLNLDYLIQIIENKAYFPYDFRQRILSNNTDSAIEFWKDPYFLKYFETEKITIEDKIKQEQNNLYNTTNENDKLFFNKKIRDYKHNLDNINDAINDAIKFRNLINKEFDDLEKEFARLLNEYKAETDKEPILKTIYGTDTEKLTEFHNKAVKAKLINPDLDSWLYWFGGILCNNPQQIQWLKKRTDAMYFIYKLCPDLQNTDRKFPLINNVVAPIQGRKFDSNDKPPINGNKVTDLIDTLF